ncbi:carcinoembryonic antigen-related cell adhesion molecule 1-like isoform X2 [Oncorhynchus tshawytscha]|nr:carcinoembryonic antigen-related cell adhesion molecule 1-like isoform X2 [Oncorhynchus tshawytscha]
MVASVVVFLTMAILSGYCAGLEVLPPGPVNGTLGGNVFFKTTINPTTLSAIVWTFGDTPVIIVDFLSSEGPVTGEGYVGRIRLDNSTGSLELLKLTIADNGEYRVILTESDLMYLSNTSLNVYDGPDGMEIKGPNEIEVGQKFTLTCSAYSNPPTSYTWMHNETEIPGHSPEFAKEKSEHSDSGDYTCTATNDVTGNKTSVVHKLSVKAEGSPTPDGLSVVVITGTVIIVLLVVEVAVSVAVYFIKKNGSNVEPMHRGGSQQHVYENPSPVYENQSTVYENPSPVYENPSPVYENPSPVRDNTQQNQSPPLPLTDFKSTYDTRIM